MTERCEEADPLVADLHDDLVAAVEEHERAVAGVAKEFRSFRRRLRALDGVMVR